MLLHNSEIQNAQQNRLKMWRQGRIPLSTCNGTPLKPLITLSLSYPYKSPFNFSEAIAELSMGRLDWVRTRPEPENASMNQVRTRK